MELSKEYEKLKEKYINKFIEKLEDNEDIEYSDFAISDEYITFGDASFSYSELRYCVDNNIKSDNLIEYFWWCVEETDDIKAIPNFEVWVKYGTEFEYL